MTGGRNKVLEDSQVRQKIRRMAYEIVENNFNAKTIVLAGIDGQGYRLAQLLSKEIATISSVEPREVKILIDKKNPEKSKVTLDVELSELKKKIVVVVDDVLNTGRTLTYAMKPLLTIELEKIQVAVLVNRSHPLFPVQPSYTGYELSTTLSDHVEVVLEKKSAVYLH